MKGLAALSAAWAQVELALSALCAAAVTALILANVVTRAFGRAIYWTDEAAIYAMIWMAFLAASASIAGRTAIAVTLMRDLLPPRGERAMAVGIDAVVLLFALLMFWLCWLWFEPLTLAAHGFDAGAFQGATFNFVYAEPTVTLGVPKVWVWLVMPLFALGMTLHAVSNLGRSLRMLRGSARAEDREEIAA